MKLPNRNLLIVATLALLTNALSLLGLQHGSAGALARNIECTSSISRNIQLAGTLKRLAGNPPCPPTRPATGALRLV